jgi:alternate signal-mediated exported protein
VKKSKQKTKFHRKKRKVNGKLMIAASAFLFSGLMVLGSTYAWFVSEDDRTNHFVGTRLSAEIVEDFEPNFEWSFGTKVKKVVQVKNTGDVPAFIRLKLYEYLLLFQVDVTDQTGNGNLAVSTNAVQPTVNQANVQTWTAAAKAGGTYHYKNNYYIAKQAVMPKDAADSYKWQDSQREKTALHWLSLNFPANIYTTKPASSTKNYWLYQDGYFYYSELLQPNEMTEPLLQSVHLRLDAPNKFKGALYKLEPVMDAHDATNVLLSSWNIQSPSPAYELYSGRLID